MPLAWEEIFRRKAAQESDARQVHATVSMSRYTTRSSATSSRRARQRRAQTARDAEGQLRRGAKRCAAQSYSEIDALMGRGTLNRTVASTSMNATSHAPTRW